LREILGALGRDQDQGGGRDRKGPKRGKSTRSGTPRAMAQ
jgi:hypothetical protein